MRLSFFDIVRLKICINTTIHEIKENKQKYKNSKDMIKVLKHLRDKLQEGYYE